MARQALVLDASVGVKWFSAVGEASVPQARAILAAHARDDVGIVVPDLFFHEISNALVHKQTISPDMVEESITMLFDLGLTVFPVSRESLRLSAHLARKAGITAYAACYAVAAIHCHCPLVTANPRHQGQALGCKVIPIDQWRS